MMKEETKNNVKTPAVKTKQPPENPAWITNIIVLVLMVLSLVIGVSLSPMISRWFENGDAPAADTADSHDHSGDATTAASESGWYVCPMHPWVVQPEEGLCPICIMDLTPLDPDRFSGEITIDPVVVQNIGIRVAPVITGSLGNSIRTVGVLEIDETRIQDVNVKLDGWIENIQVDYQGAPVRAGQKLLEIYSPDLLASQKEYLVLWNSGSSAADEQLLASARRRLELLDVSEKQIKALEESGTAQRTVTMFAPTSGFVVDKLVDSGQKVSAGNTLYRVADLRTVWLLAKVYEHQLANLKVGSTAEVSFSSFPDQSYQAKVDYIFPTVDQKTRQVDVRLVMNNRKGELKPGMYADVIIGSGAEEENSVLAPREAIIITGERSVAFVSLGDGAFEPRTVTVGRHAAGRAIEIIDGLKPGEQVVVSGQFLLDSESRIRESLVKMIKGDLASDQKPSLEMPTTHSIVVIPEAGYGALSSVLAEYLDVHSILFEGNDFSQLAGAVRLLEFLKTMEQFPPAGNEHFWHMNTDYLETVAAAEKLQTVSTLADARLAFSEVGYFLNRLIRTTGLPPEFEEELMGVQCGMFEGAPDGGVWLQRVGDTENPFFGLGSAMETCSTDKWALPVAGEAPQPVEVIEAEPVTQPVQSTVHTDNDDPVVIFLNHYLAIHEELYLDSLVTAQQAGRELQDSLENIEIDELQKLDQVVDALVVAQDLDAARNAYGILGVALNEYFLVNGLPADIGKNLVTKHCGMYTNAPEDGMWIQAAGDTRNPFFGHEHFMAACAPKEWPLEVKGNR